MTVLAPGSTIGRYRIRSRIGAGGMGVVYLALDEGLERQVALKVVAPELARDPQFLTRFNSEARAAAAVEHAHLLPIFEAGEDDGRLYLAMRYVPGFDLGTLIDREALSLERTVVLVTQIADALDAAHAAGLVHRDVKPSNVLVGPGDHAYLADFGLAIAVAQSARLTRSGEMAVGSADYIAPELVAGQPPDARSDVYSLACLTYACLTGAPPFDRGDEMARLYAHVHDAPPSASSWRPDLPSGMDDVLNRGLAKDPAQRPASAGAFAFALAKAAGVSRGVREAPDEGPADIALPYVGLRAFLEEDAEFFFGREAEVDALLEKLKEERFLAVFGPSGSGKSSLVRAGLVPALRRGAIDGSDRWPIRVLRPGAHPLEVLAQQLVGLRPDASVVRTLDDVAGDARTLALETGLALPDDDPNARFVWIIDQAEELFTLADEREQRAAIGNLVHAGTVPDGRAIVVLAMRADFYHRCALYPELAAAVARAQYLVSPMEADALVRAIIEPAALVGLKFEPGLVETLLDDIGGRTGGLPLLEHALTELWERRRGATLTLAAYRAAGGVEGAIATRAETVYGGLEPAQQDRVRQLFLRLTVPGEGTEDTKRRAPLRELVVQANDSGELEQVVDDLVRARLVTVAADESGEPMVDMAHEALLRAWPRMQEWIAESRDALRSRRRIADAAAEWQRLDQDEDALLRGARLVEAREFAAAQPQLLNEDERAFVSASGGREVDERNRRDRARRRVTVAAFGLAAIFLVAAAGTALLWRASDEQRALADQQRLVAETERARAVSRQVASQALNNLNKVDLALLLSVEAARNREVIEGRGSLLTALQLDPRLERFLPGHANAVADLRFSADGRHLASSSTDVAVWEVETGTAVMAARSADHGLRAVAISADGGLVGALAFDGQLDVWDVMAGEPTLSVEAGAGGILAAGIAGSTLAFATEGRELLAAAADGSVSSVDLQTGTVDTVVSAAGSSLFDVATGAVSPDGRWFASAFRDGRVALRSVGQAAVERHLEPTPPDEFALSLSFSTDGTALAGAFTDGTVRVWDTTTGTPREFSLPEGAEAPIVVDVSTDGRLIATAAASGTIAVWDVSSGEAVGPPLTGYAELPNALRFSADSERLATGYRDGRVAIWTLSASSRLGSPIPDAPMVSHEEPLAYGLSADGRLVAAGGWSGDAAEIAVFQLPSGEIVSRVPIDTLEPISAIGVGANRGLVATVAQGAQDGTSVTVRAVGSGSIALQHDTPIWPVTTLVFSADERSLAIGGLDGNGAAIEIVDLSTGTVRVRLRDDVVGSGAVALSADGSLLAAGSGGFTSGSVPHAVVAVWSIEGDQPAIIKARADLHGEVVGALVFAPDEMTLAVGLTRELYLDAPEGELILFDIASGLPIATLADRPVSALGFSPADQSLVAGGPNGFERWNLDYAAWEAAACSIANRNLTTAEWERYLGNTPYRATCPGAPAPPGLAP